MYLDKQTNKYITKNQYIKRFGEKDFNAMYLAQVTLPTQAAQAAQAAEKAAQSTADAAEMAKLLDQADKAQKNKSTIGYVCGATSVVGVIVLLTGIKKDKAGIQNTYFDS